MTSFKYSSTSTGAIDSAFQTSIFARYSQDTTQLKMSDVHLDDFSSLFSLDGKVAVVTGGSRGLGLHAASGYAHINRMH